MDDTTSAKRQITAALSAIGVRTLAARYDGYNDEGDVWIDGALDADGSGVDIGAAVSCLPRHEGEWVFDTGHLGSLEDDCCDMLSREVAAAHAGWECGGGACGRLTFDVATGRLTIADHEWKHGRREDY